MRMFLIGLLIALMNLSALECDAQTSRLPKEMPDALEINFNKNAGMLFAYTKIEIARQTITVEEKAGNEQQARRWSAKITAEEQENLYKIFVENKFDTLKNDKREGIIYDAGSEGISINAGNGAFYSISYGPNTPLSGDNLKRYQAVSGAISALRLRYEGKAQKSDNSNFVVFDYNAKEHHWIFKNALAVKLSEDEITEVKTLVKKAVDTYNLKQTDSRTVINLQEYKFQFLPITNEKGEKEVWVNAFCSTEKDWQKQIVFVLDGGKCFFQVFTNLTQKSFDLSVNGAA